MKSHTRDRNRSPRKYASMVMLSLLFLMSSRCDNIEDPYPPLEVDLAQTSGFDVIVTGGTLPESDFFPLRVGTEWAYELVHADADTASEAFAFPDNFTVSVIGVRYVDGEMYNTIDNYLIPGTDFPATALMREESGRVYVLIDCEEYLLYSFDSDTTQWMVPLKTDSELTENHNAGLVDLTGESAVISWDLSGFPGPDRPNAVDTEAGWADVFNPGLGRARVVSMTEAYGLTVWDLKEIIASDTELEYPEPNPNYAPGSLIVKFTKSAATQKDFRIRVEQARVITGLPTIDSLCALFKASSFKPYYREIYDPIEYEKLGRDRLFILQFPAKSDMENIADIFLKDPNIEEAYPNYLVMVM